MASFAVVEYPYLGSLLAVNLLSADTTIFLTFFGSSVASTLVDDGTRLYVNELLTMGGQNYEFVGSGTAQPGINILGLTVPTGFPKDLILLRNTSTGQLHFVFPDGVPNATGMIAMVIHVDPVGYDLTTKGPLCFADGTRVETLDGPVAVEALEPGIRLISPNGPPMTLLARLKEDRQDCSPAFRLPVIVRAGAFGLGPPAQDLRLSQQHRLGVAGPQLGLMFGMEWALAPALGFVDFDRVLIGYADQPTYCHLLCDRHGLCLADGIAAETLAWGPRAIEDLGPDRTAALRAQHPALRRPHKQCLPSLSVAETRILCRSKGPVPAGLRHEAFLNFPGMAGMGDEAGRLTPPCPQNPRPSGDPAVVPPHPPSSC